MVSDDVLFFLVMASILCAMWSLVATVLAPKVTFATDRHRVTPLLLFIGSMHIISADTTTTTALPLLSNAPAQIIKTTMAC